MPPRIPTEADFAPLQTSHPSSPQPTPPPITLIYPNPPESTTTLLILLHGLGDTHAPFAAFARNLALPGVLGIAVRGTAPLPALLTSADGGGGEGPAGYHWGDDVRFSSGDGELDPDPGFERARAWIMEQLVRGVLVGKCGWDVEDVMVFGFGQGGALALGLASGLRLPAAVAEGGSSGRVVDVTEDDRQGKDKNKGKQFKGVVSVGGALPPSMVPSVGGLGKAATPVLVCCGRESEAVDEDAVELLEREFEQVKVVRWKRPDDGMPRNREEVLPMMQFFAERLRSGWL